ncbi:MAG: alpha/beta hydrolase [Acidobacteriota bacterium]
MINIIVRIIINLIIGALAGIIAWSVVELIEYGHSYGYGRFDLLLTYYYPFFSEIPYLARILWIGALNGAITGLIMGPLVRTFNTVYIRMLWGVSVGIICRLTIEFIVRLSDGDSLYQALMPVWSISFAWQLILVGAIVGLFISSIKTIPIGLNNVEKKPILYFSQNKYLALATALLLCSIFGTLGYQILNLRNRAFVCLTSQATSPAEGRLKMDRAILHFKIYGNGTPILLLSGGPGFESDYLTNVAMVLSKNYQCILLDQRGTGKSPVQGADKNTINLETNVNDIEELRKHLGLDKLIILGHSWGGQLAMAYAGTHPSSIRALILIGSGGINLNFQKQFNANTLSRLRPCDKNLLDFWGTHAVIDPDRTEFELVRAILPTYFYQRQDTLMLTENLTMKSLSRTTHYLIQDDLTEKKYDLRDLLKDFKEPVLVIQGKNDPIDESTADEISRNMSSSQLVFIEKSGHFPWIDQCQEFYTAVNNFLKSLP